VRKGEAFSLMSYLHSGLTDIKTNKERAEVVASIKQLNAEIKDIWDQLDHYQKTKTFLREPALVAEIPKLNKFEANKRLLNVRTNISKLKKKDKSEKNLIKLVNLETEKLQLETLLAE
jgi:hypothetical protein